MPSSTHMEMAQESPRALNDPVGFRPSSLISRSVAPMRVAGAAGAEAAASSLRPVRQSRFHAERAKPERSATWSSGAVAKRVAGPGSRGAVQIVADQQRSAAFAEVPALPASNFRLHRLHSRCVILSLGMNSVHFNLIGLCALALPVWARGEYRTAERFPAGCGRHEIDGGTVRIFSGGGVTEMPVGLIASVEQVRAAEDAPAPLLHRSPRPAASRRTARTDPTTRQHPLNCAGSHGRPQISMLCPIRSSQRHARGIRF